MTPIEQAMQVYEQEPCARTFEEDLQLHRLYGFVFDELDYFIMGRPVMSVAPPVQIINPGFTFPHHVCDCWHIYLMAGDTRKAWDIMPWPLPYFSFERKNELRVYPMERIRRLSLGERLTTP